MPCPSLLPMHQLRSVQKSSTSWTEEGDAWFVGLDGHDLEASLAVARAIIAAGAWRPWMAHRFMRLHRHEVSRLLRRLVPLLPHPRILRRPR
jgi:hypothetical protein